MGNLFRGGGYDTYAYHNHTYNYYSRHLSHPQFGYLFHGIDNGLTLPSSVWPASDLEMAQATAPDFLAQAAKSGQPFHAYYMTVSGHATGTFTPTEACPLEGEELDAYVQNNVRHIHGMRNASLAILDHDYYRYVFDDSFQPLKTLDPKP